MTMFLAHLSSSKYVHSGFSDGGYDCFISLGRGISDLMADDDSRNSRNETSVNKEEAGSSMKDVDNNNIHDEDDHGQWLQLSLGGGHMQTTTTRRMTTELSVLPSIDFDLLGGGGSASIQHPPPLPSPPPAPTPPQFFFQVPEFRGAFLQSHETTAAMSSESFMTLQQQQETNYNNLQLLRPFPANMMTLPLNLPLPSSSSFSGSTQQHGRPVHIHRRLNIARVINPPRRLHSGVWFMLQASQNQAKEPFLPQIPKSYVRIKDGKMTVGLLIKYLVNKLELGSDSEIEITCKGRQLLSISTLQHVRDTIWNNPRNDVGFTFVPQSSATINHLMVLNYGRIA